MPAHESVTSAVAVDGEPELDDGPYTPPPWYVACYVMAGSKGGLGKTTSAMFFAFALALAERRVLLVDADPASQSAFTWAALYRELFGQDFPITVVQYTTSAGMAAYVVKLMAEGGYTDLVVDVGGESDSQLRAALRAAHAWAQRNAERNAHVEVVMPCNPSSLDTVRVLPTLNTVSDVAAELGTGFVQRVLITRPGSAQKMRTARQALADEKVTVMNTVIKSHVKYACAPKIPRSCYDYFRALQELVEAEITDDMINSGPREKAVRP